MNNTLETEKRKKEVPIAELVHKSLVAHGIITNPRVIKCGTYYSWERHIKKLLGVEDLDQYASHSVRKCKATVIFNKTRNIDAVRRLLGQSSVTATSSYIGVTDNSALELARNINV